jgi:LysM repeat protein
MEVQGGIRRIIKMRKVALGAAVFVAAAVSLTGGSKVQAESAEQKKNQQPQTVVVQPGDSLSKIGNAHNTTYQRLFYANVHIKDPNLIYADDTLRIPRADEQLTERPLPSNVQALEYEQKVVNPKPQPAPAIQTSTGGDVWDRLAQCESGGNWHINTGNGYYGGLQFSLRTWQGVGGVGYPHEASREEQIARGQILQVRSGWGQWPACTAKLGLR